MSPYRVIFMGTPDFAVPALQALITASTFQVVGVVTQPDRPAGRGNAIQYSPVKVAALTAQIPILQPAKLREPGIFEQLQAWEPDLIVVAAFGQILRQNVLDLPRYGCINIHASLLPRWRGAAPIQAVIRAGDSRSGITIMKMDVGLDTGPMLKQQAIPLEASETGATLHDKLAAIGGTLLIDTLEPYINGDIAPQPQNDADHTYAPMLKKEDGLINWEHKAIEIERQVRAFHPWPGTYTLWNGQNIKILPQKTENNFDPPVVINDHAAVGEIVRLANGQIGIGTGDGIYIPALIQLAGRSVTTVQAFISGHKDFVGTILGK